MSYLHDSLGYSGGVDGRVTCGREERSNKESGFLGFNQEINLVLGREDRLEN